jgi:hypothetical protein
LGTIKNTEKHARRLHPTIAFTPNQICLGVVKATYWARDTKSPREERRKKGIDEKESGHWIDSYQDSCALQGLLPHTRIVNVADREGDLYEWYAEYEDHAAHIRADWIVRAAQDRRVQAEEGAKLWSVLKAAPVLGTLNIDLKARGNQAARKASVTVQAATVVLTPPARIRYHLPKLTVNALLAYENSPPPGVKPLEWLLLTSLPVNTFEYAMTIIEWYAVRWCIEIFFHVLKSGCQIEHLQLETEDRLLPCLALYMIIAWRVLFTMMLGRACPDINCEVIFESQEWHAVYIVVKRCPLPQIPPRLGEIVLLIASLGGYLGRKHDAPPGPKAMWIGLQRLRDFVLALNAREALQN